MPRVRRHGLDVGRYEIAAVMLIVLGVAVRAGLLVQGWPHLNSDEGAVGLMALHIAYRGDHPIFEYGQSYMGAVEPYLAAISFKLFGVSLLTLRIGLDILFALFLAGFYVLVRLLYSRQVSIFCLAILALGSHEVLFRQLEGEGGIQEMLVFVTLALLLASHVVLSPDDRASSRRNHVYLGLGLAAGLALYSDPLAAPYLAACIATLLFLRSRETWRRAPWLLSGAVLGLAPALLYNLTSTPLGATVAELSHRYHAAGGVGTGTISILSRVAGTILVALPAQTGGTAICSLRPGQAWPLSIGSTRHVLACTAVHGLWGVCLIGLWGLAVLLTLRHLRQPKSSGIARDRVADARHAARLMLLGGAGLTVAIYGMSSAPALQPWGTQRYLSGVWLGLPALVALIPPGTPRTGLRAVGVWLGRFALPGILLGTLLVGTVAAYRAQDEVADNRWSATIVADLEKRGLTRIYTDYWTCYRLAFLSRERVACRVVDDTFRLGWDRDPSMSRIVERDPNAVYFLPGSWSHDSPPLATGTQTHLRFWLDGYIVYRRPLPALIPG